jgi:hypothetical protein
MAQRLWCSGAVETTTRLRDRLQPSAITKRVNICHRGGCGVAPGGNGGGLGAGGTIICTTVGSLLTPHLRPFAPVVGLGPKKQPQAEGPCLQDENDRPAGKGSNAGLGRGEAFVACGESYRRSKALVFTVAWHDKRLTKALHLQRLSCAPAAAV